MRNYSSLITMLNLLTRHDGVKPMIVRPTLNYFMVYPINVQAKQNI